MSARLNAECALALALAGTCAFVAAGACTPSDVPHAASAGAPGEVRPAFPTTPPPAPSLLRELALASVPELASAWTLEGVTAAERVSAPDRAGETALALVRDEGRELVLVARDSGQTLWSVRAPGASAFLRIVAAGPTILGLASEGARATDVAFDVRDGHVVWERASEGSLEHGLDGTGLFRGHDGLHGGRADRGCTSQLVDPATGRDFGAPFVSSTYEEWPIDHPEERRVECSTDFALLGFMGGRALVGMSARLEATAGVSAVDPSASATHATRGYDQPFGAGSFAQVSREPVTGVYTSFGAELILLRFDPPSGALVWQAREPLARDGCVELPWPFLRGVRAGENGAPSILVQDCRTVTLVDGHTGATRWRLDENEARAVLDGEAAEDEPLPDWHPGGRPFRRFARDGRALERVAAPADAERVYAAPEGLLVAGKGFLGLLAWSGSYTWAWHAPATTLALRGNVIAAWLDGAHASGARDFVWLERASGRILGRARGELVAGPTPGRTPPEPWLFLDGTTLRALHTEER